MSGKYLLINGVVGNHALFWRRGRCGYTTDIHNAHRFTEREAFAQHKMRPEDIPIPEVTALQGVELCFNVERAEIPRWEDE